MIRTTGRASAVAGAFREARELDRTSMRPPGAPGTGTPWMPYDCAEFSMMLLEAIAEAGGHRFLDIGCGAGSKMIIAQSVFGLRGYGFDTDVALVARAQHLGLPAGNFDALHFSDYGKFDILWFNRPLRDRGLQRRLEAKIWDETAPGAVVICANLEDKPPSNWLIVLEDWEIRRGVWKKPGA